MHINNLIPHKSLKSKYRHWINPTLLALVEKDFSTINLMSNEDTINYIIDNGCSYARYGDGEIGYLLSKDFKHFFQPYNKNLQNKLKQIFSYPIPNCKIGIPIWMATKSLDQFYQNCQIKYFYKFKEFLKIGDTYGCSHCFCANSLNVNVDLVKKIWDKKNVLLVTGKNSAFIYDERLFGNASKFDFIYTKAVDAFSEYENILKQIKNYDKSTLVLLSLGLTATCLAYDLSKLGYQAIDIGHISNYYLNSKGEMISIEKLRMSKQYIDGVTDIKTLMK